MNDENLNDSERAICEAIGGKRIIRFMSKGCPRIAEPHDFGIIKGQRRLFYYQVGGASRSGLPDGWRWADPAEMQAVQLLDIRFPGSRPVRSGRQHRWDRLIASVSRPTPHAR